jgi:hypothetical protein
VVKFGVVRGLRVLRKRQKRRLKRRMYARRAAAPSQLVPVGFVEESSGE